MAIPLRGYIGQAARGASSVGSMFRVIDRMSADEPTETQWLPQSSPLRVLLVDDCPIEQVLVCAVLARWGIAPEIACHGVEAVQLAAERDFDIIFMDVEMPVMDGFTATAHIRAFERDRPWHRPVPVVAYSAADLHFDDVLLSQSGMNGVLHKPCDSLAMAGCLLRWCEGKFDPTRTPEIQGHAERG